MKKYFTIVTTTASFCLFICAIVFASNSGHFRINDFLLFITPLLLLNIFVKFIFILAKKWGGGGGARGAKDELSRTHCWRALGEP